MHVLGGHRTPIARWDGPVRFALVGEIDQAVEATVLSIFSEISLFTGIHIQRIHHEIKTAADYASALAQSPPYDMTICDNSNPGVCANFVVIVSGRTDMNRVAVTLPLRPVYQRATAPSDQVLCFFSPGLARGTEIVRSIVYVDSELDKTMINTCLQEEIYQSFGLFGDYSKSRYFSFNNEVTAKRITPYDKRLLTSLYDRAFPRGTFAAPVASQLSEYCVSGC